MPAQRLPTTFLVLFAVGIGGTRAYSLHSAAAGMQKEIGGENKGFQMMQKMGWSSGALGRNSEGIVKPIDPLEMSNFSPRRSGLGSQSAKKIHSPRKTSKKNADTELHKFLKKNGIRDVEGSWKEKRAKKEEKTGSLLATTLRHLHLLPDAVVESMILELERRVKQLKLPPFIVEMLWSFFLNERQEHVVLPTTLTSFQRKQVHVLAYDVGLLHRSKGTGKNRKMILRKSHATRKSVSSSSKSDEASEETVSSADVSSSSLEVHSDRFFPFLDACNGRRVWSGFQISWTRKTTCDSCRKTRAGWRLVMRRPRKLRGEEEIEKRDEGESHLNSLRCDRKTKKKTKEKKEKEKFNHLRSDGAILG
eukprot:655668-Hanusia_phi.AAC.1